MNNKRTLALKTALMAQGSNVSRFARFNGVKPPQIYRILEGAAKSERIERNIELAIQDGKLKVAEIFKLRSMEPTALDDDSTSGSCSRRARTKLTREKEL